MLGKNDYSEDLCYYVSLFYVIGLSCNALRHLQVLYKSVILSIFLQIHYFQPREEDSLSPRLPRQVASNKLLPPQQMEVLSSRSSPSLRLSTEQDTRQRAAEEQSRTGLGQGTPWYNWKDAPRQQRYKF